MANEKIDFEQFREKVSNLDTSDEELASFFTEVDTEDQDFPGNGPRVQIDVSKVNLENADDPRVEGAVLFEGANTLAKFRRRLKFKRKVNASSTKHRKVLVTEGDSWFQFPFIIQDVVDHLSKSFNVYSIGAAGDTTKNMVFKNPEFIEAIMNVEDIIGRQPDGFVFSSGGNDLLGMDGDIRVLGKIVRVHQPGEEVNIETAFNEQLLKEQLDLIRSGYRALIKDIHANFEGLPIFMHGYDRVFPASDSSEDARKSKGRWIRPPLSEQGVTAFSQQRKITDHLIAQFRNILLEMENEHENVHFINTGQPLAEDVSLWHDEIHPTSAGYQIVTRKFTETINRVLGDST